MKQTNFNFYDLSDLQDDTSTFNSIAGNDTKLTDADLTFQAKLIQDELDELKTALFTNDKVEVLDGILDVLVCAYGMVQKLEALGYDVNNAAKEVAWNNLSKYPRSLEDAKKTIDGELKDGWSISYNRDANCWVIKDANGKIRKPWNFKDVDIQRFVPQ